MIFEKQVARKPDHYPWANDFINAMWQNPWNANKFSFQADVQDYLHELTEEEQAIVRNTLSAIGQIEINVKMFWANMGKTLPHPSLIDLGLVMAGVEVIHNKAYEKLLDTLNLADIYQDNLKLDVIKGRVAYLNKHAEKNFDEDKKQFIYSLILFTLFVENVSLFTQFYIILWFGKYRNVLKDTTQQVNYTKNEELIHAMVGIKLVNTIRAEHPELFDSDLERRISRAATEAFKAESKIIDWMIGDYKAEGISADILKEYLKNRINESMDSIGYKKPFDIDDAVFANCQWMIEKEYGNTVTDFFHKHSTDYVKNHRSIKAADIFPL